VLIDDQDRAGSLQGTFKPPMSRVRWWGREGNVINEEGWAGL
jgi:hypothetical protein